MQDHDWDILKYISYNSCSTCLVTVCSCSHDLYFLVKSVARGCANTGAVYLSAMSKALSWHPAELLWRISCGTVAGRGAELQLHARRQIQTHAGTHIRWCTPTSGRAAVMMCRPEGLKNSNMHQEADVFSSWCPFMFQRRQLRSACLSSDILVGVSWSHVSMLVCVFCIVRVCRHGCQCVTSGILR